MKRALLLCCLLPIALLVYAKSWYSFRYLCSDSSHDYYEFESAERGIWTFVPQRNGSQIQLDNPQGLKLLRFARPSRSVLLYFNINITDEIMAGHRKCEADPLASQPVNECLGVNPLSLGLAAQGIFTVDGNAYHYADNLSFFVPIDAVWHWDLWVDGQLVLRFEQTATEACHIIED